MISGCSSCTRRRSRSRRSRSELMFQVTMRMGTLRSVRDSLSWDWGPLIAEKANARPGEDRAVFSPLSESRGRGGDRFLGKPQPLRPRLSALGLHVGNPLQTFNSAFEESTHKFATYAA